MRRLIGSTLCLRRNLYCHQSDIWARSNHHPRHFLSRTFPPQSSDDSKPKTPEWRKYQLDKLSASLSKNIQSNTPTDEDDDDSTNKQGIPVINSDDELQQMWKEMESRVINRKVYTVQQSESKGRTIGRGNVKRTDEEVWLDAGLYTRPTLSNNASDNETKTK